MCARFSTAAFRVASFFVLWVTATRANLTLLNEDDADAESSITVAQEPNYSNAHRALEGTDIFDTETTTQVTLLNGEQNNCFVDQCRRNSDCCREQYCDIIAHPTPGIGECRFIDPVCRTRGQNCNNKQYQCCFGFDCVQNICREQGNVCQLEGDFCSNQQNLRCCPNSNLECQASRCTFVGSNCQVQGGYCDRSNRPNTNCCSGFTCSGNRCVRNNSVCQRENGFCDRKANSPETKCCSGFTCSSNRCVRNNSVCQGENGFCDRVANSPSTKCCSGFTCTANRCIRTGSVCQNLLDFCDNSGRPNTECCAGLECSGNQCRNGNDPGPNCRWDGEPCLSIRDCCDNHRCMQERCTWVG